MEGLLGRAHNPDVLTCIVNLSNDEVFTPPEMASAMLDMVAEAWAADHGGENLWANPDATFLDPFTKTGVFLREITRRLVEGLEARIPDLQERVNHVLTKQVYGIAITELTALMARRSLYCSKRANSEHSICTAFDTPDGNIWFERTKHTWTGGTRESRIDPITGDKIFVYTNRECSFCNAKEKNYGRGEELETHAYAFIHTDNIKQRIDEIFGAAMHFDIVIGNPPYQLSDGGGGGRASATPIYNLFAEAAFDLEPKYAVMVTPSRWFSGGKGLDSFRARMLSERHLRELVDFPQLYDVFPGVKIRGGVSYWLWDGNHCGDCVVRTIVNKQLVSEPTSRDISRYDVFVRDNRAESILEKTYQGAGLAEECNALSSMVLPRRPFGLESNVRLSEKPVSSEPVLIYAYQRTGFLGRKDITTRSDLIDRWKVISVKAHGTSGKEDLVILGRPTIAEPGSACTETYLVIGDFDSEIQANSLSSYLQTRFVRFLASLRKISQNITRDTYRFVPIEAWDRIWSDEELYAKYGLTDEEIAFIESIVRPMEDE